MFSFCSLFVPFRRLKKKTDLSVNIPWIFLHFTCITNNFRMMCLRVVSNSMIQRWIQLCRPLVCAHYLLFNTGAHHFEIYAGSFSLWTFDKFACTSGKIESRAGPNKNKKSDERVPWHEVACNIAVLTHVVWNEPTSFLFLHARGQGTFAYKIAGSAIFFISKRSMIMTFLWKIESVCLSIMHLLFFLYHRSMQHLSDFLFFFFFHFLLKKKPLIRNHLNT